ncbi:MAG: DMT family transporter [Dehalococcoidales bacterium]|nr:DMT family transporter [Dehalococcoidales bacterium]
MELALTGSALAPLPLPAVLGVLYLGAVSTAGAFYLWNKGMALLESDVAAVFFFAQPVVGAFLGWLLLHERLGPSFFLGGALIFAGVAAVSLALPVPAKERAAPE